MEDKIMRQILAAVAVTGLIAAGVFFCGCEDNPDTENVDSYFDSNSIDVADDRPNVSAFVLSPDSVIIDKDGDVAKFKVTDKTRAVYWSIKDHSKGALLTQTSEEATYKRTAAGDNVVIATDGAGNTSFATVKQPFVKMSITPDSLTMSNDLAIVQFTLTGASGPVTWTVQNNAAGTILTQSTTAATYRRDGSGNNVLIANDASGNAAFATITQP
jgi:hypothetical protein